LEGRYPYLWLDAKVERVREPGGVRHKALVIAYGVHQSGRREIVGLDVGEAETEAFWREFLRGLRARGLAGVRLCVSDAHEGLRQAIAKVLGCPWQRCSVHFLRDMLGHVSKAQQPMIAAAIRGIFQAASLTEAHQRLVEVVDRLRPHAAKVARLLEDAEADLLAFYGFPAEHWSKLRSTNPLERVNREIGRRTDVVCECWACGLRRTVCQAPMLAPRHDSRCRWRVVAALMPSRLPLVPASAWPTLLAC
jgi:transposase-like protein